MTTWAQGGAGSSPVAPTTFRTCRSHIGHHRSFSRGFETVRRARQPARVRSTENPAGLLWIFRSPLVREGLYGYVDVGAGTTDGSFFRIRTRPEGGTGVKYAVGFYSARSSPRAMDALGDCLARIDGDNLSAALLRGQENAIIQRHAVAKHPSVNSVCGQVYETYRRAWSDAFQKEKRESASNKYGLFVLGGRQQGRSRHRSPLRDGLARRAHNRRRRPSRRPLRLARKGTAWFRSERMQPSCWSLTGCRTSGRTCRCSGHRGL